MLAPRALEPRCLCCAARAGMGRGCSRLTLPGKGWASTAQDGGRLVLRLRTACGVCTAGARWTCALKKCRVASRRARTGEG